MAQGQLRTLFSDGVLGIQTLVGPTTISSGSLPATPTRLATETASSANRRAFSISEVMTTLSSGRPQGLTTLLATRTRPSEIRAGAQSPRAAVTPPLALKQISDQEI